MGFGYNDNFVNKLIRFIFFIFLVIFLRVFNIIVCISVGVFLLGVILEYYKFVIKFCIIVFTKFLIVVFIMGELNFFFYFGGGGVEKRWELFIGSCFFFKEERYVCLLVGGIF